LRSVDQTAKETAKIQQKLITNVNKLPYKSSAAVTELLCLLIVISAPFTYLLTYLLTERAEWKKRP